MATASSSGPSSSNSADSKSQHDLQKQIRRHEVALAELEILPSTRGVYQRNGNIFFQTTIQKATASEKKELDLAKVKLQRLNV